MKTVLMLRASMFELASGEYILRGVNIDRLRNTNVVIFSASTKRKLGLGAGVELFYAKSVSFVRVESDTKQMRIAIRFEQPNLVPIDLDVLPDEIKKRSEHTRTNRFFIDAPDSLDLSTNIDKQFIFSIQQEQQSCTDAQIQDKTLSDFSVEEILQHLKQRLGQNITITI